MDKIKTVKIKNEDGSVSKESYYISANANCIDMTNGYNVQETVGVIDVDNDGSIAEQIDNINNNIDDIELDIKKKAYFFDTVTDMKNAILKNGDYVITLGYYEPNDGGAGKYRIVNGNYTDNGGSYHKLSNGLFAELIIENEINFKQFGPKGGDVDASVELQKAIYFACSGNKKLVIDKIYKIGNQINISSPLQLYGLRSEQSGFELTSRNAHFHIFNQGGLVYNQRWKDITIKCNNIAEYGIIGQVSQCYFDNLFISHPTKACVRIRSSLNWWNRCFFYYAPVAVELYSLTSCNQFIECNFWDNDVLFKACGDALEKARVASLFIDNCWFEGFNSLLDHNGYVSNFVTYVNNTHLTPHINTKSSKRLLNYIYKPSNPLAYQTNNSYNFIFKSSNSFFYWAEALAQTDDLIQLDPGITSAFIDVNNYFGYIPTNIPFFVNVDNIQVSRWLIRIAWQNGGTRMASDLTKCVTHDVGLSYYGVSHFYNGIAVGSDIPCNVADLPAGQLQYDSNEKALKLWNGSLWDFILSSKTKWDILLNGKNISSTSTSYTLESDYTNYTSMIIRIRNGTVTTDTIFAPTSTTKIISTGNQASWDGESRKIMIDFTSHTTIEGICSGGTWTIDIFGIK